MEFFRHCPGCGRRFHIKLESKKLVDLERTSRTNHECYEHNGWSHKD